MSNTRTKTIAVDADRNFLPRRRDLGDTLQNALRAQGVDVEVRNFKQDRRTGIRHTFILGTEPQVASALEFCRKHYSPIEITYYHRAVDDTSDAKLREAHPSRVAPQCKGPTTPRNPAESSTQFRWELWVAGHVLSFGAFAGVGSFYNEFFRIGLPNKVACLISILMWNVIAYAVPAFTNFPSREDETFLRRVGLSLFTCMLAALILFCLPKIVLLGGFFLFCLSPLFIFSLAAAVIYRVFRSDKP